MKTITFYIFLCIFCSSAFAQLPVSETNANNSFLIASSSSETYIYTDSTDNWLIQKAAQFLQNDIEMITGTKPKIIHSLSLAKQKLIIIGSLQQSATIQHLAVLKKIDVNALKNQWEAFSITTITAPSLHIKKALVIAGSDKRGTAYGVFELSKQMGVSPWYWWADVPVKKKKEIFITNGSYYFPSPSVKYRGIFINDEAPAFSGWAREKFGGVNHLAYEKIFELLLRFKANYLWPAMWDNAFNDDDTLNPILANKYGIVMGTSHHEPMLRAQQEWKRYGKGAWNYTTNDSVLRSFWRKGIQNMKTHESIITIGMRGDGDEPMTEGTAISLLEKIVTDQRKIITDVTKKPASQQPQLWALYKEVQEYYDKGMRVPDDVTLLLCDDNWGNIRKLPKLTDPKRKGGYGIYYHFDYVGDPRNYKWINTNNISRVWEQMHLAYEYGVDKIWIVNVGDLKPMELPISFFLDYAWNTKKWNENNLLSYYTNWAQEQFGKENADDIGKMLEKYAQLSARRKPELLDADTYSIHNYNEANRVTNEWEQLLFTAEKTYALIPAEYKDAYFELVLHPIKAFTNLQQLYTTVAYNRFAAKYQQANASPLADKAKKLYCNDSLITVQYHQIANGKWNHMMDQTHIGYTYWQQPPFNKMPDVTYVPTDSVKEEIVIIKGRDKSAEKIIQQNNVKNIFYELNGYVSMNAEDFTKKINTNSIEWKIIPNIGRNSSGITPFPVTASQQNITSNSAHVEYELHTYDSNYIKLNTYFSPTLDFHNTGGLKCALSIDDDPPQIININEGQNNSKTWSNWVANNIIVKTTNHFISKPGRHIIKYWMIDPGIVLQKIIADLGGFKTSYLGPEETKTSNN
jgi:hypothetical protein